MTKPTAAFFINPASHTVATRGSVLEPVSREHADVLAFNLKDFRHLPAYCEKAGASGAELIFIEGGDGTVQGVISHIIRNAPKTMPNFVILPGGMTNLAAINIGMKKPTTEKVAHILDNSEKAKQTNLSLLKVRPGKKANDHYGFLFTTGAWPMATKYCYDKIHTEGIGGAAAVRATLLHVLLGRSEERRKMLANTPLGLKSDTATLNGDHLTTISTTLPNLMIGVNPFWGEGDGLVRLTHAGPDVRYKVLCVARMMKKTQSEKSRAALKRDGFQSWNLDNAELDYDGPLVLDGEFLDNRPGPISVSATGPLTFLN